MDSTLSRTTAPVLVLLALLGFGGGVVCADVVAVVSGEPISRADFGLSLVRSLGRSALETLVDWALVEQEARRLGIEPTDADLAARKELEVELGMRAVMEKSRTGPQQFRAAAQRYEWDLGALRSELEESISDNGLRIQLMVERMLEPRMDLGEEALRKHYDRTRGERYSGAHVLVASRRHAESLLRALRDNPELWTEAVLQSSLDRPSVPYRGRIRPVPASSELGKVFAGMDADELRLHCDGEYWHVCQFIEKIPAAEESFEDTRDQLKAELVVLKAREGFHALLARLNANANIVMNLSTVPGARQLLGEEVAAFVNGEPLWIADLSEKLIEEFGRQMLQSHVERTLIFQEAGRRGLAVTDEELDERMGAIAEQLFEEQALQGQMAAQDLARSLKAAGIAVADFKERLLQEFVAPKDVRATLLAEKMVADGVEVTEEEVQEVFREFCGERLIVKEAVADSRAAARQMHHRIRQGASFDLTAQTSSTGPGVWMERGTILSVTSASPYYVYVKDLEEGGISGVFEHDGKYRIIKLLRRHLPPEPPSLESMRPSVEREVFLRKARKRIRALLLKLRAEADIEVSLE